MPDTKNAALGSVRADFFAVREFVKKSAASAASLDYVKFRSVIKSAASAAFPETSWTLEKNEKNRDSVGRQRSLHARRLR